MVAKTVPEVMLHSISQSVQRMSSPVKGRSGSTFAHPLDTRVSIPPDSSEDLCRYLMRVSP